MTKISYHDICLCCIAIYDFPQKLSDKLKWLQWDHNKSNTSWLHTKSNDWLNGTKYPNPEHCMAKVCGHQGYHNPIPKRRSPSSPSNVRKYFSKVLLKVFRKAFWLDFKSLWLWGFVPGLPQKQKRCWARTPRIQLLIPMLFSGVKVGAQSLNHLNSSTPTSNTMSLWITFGSQGHHHARRCLGPWELVKWI